MIARIFLVTLVALGIPSSAFAITDTALEGRSSTSSSAAASATTCKTDSTYCYCDAGGDGHLITDATARASQCTCEGAKRWDLMCINMAETGIRVDGGSTTTTKVEVTIEITGGEPLKTPNLIVDIPGVNFEDSVGYDDEGNLRVNYLGAYIDGVYRFAIPALTIVAVVMLMVSGMQYMLARGNTEQLKKAKHRIGNAIVGLVILLAAFNILYVVNPDFIRFDPLTIKNVEREEIPQSEENPENLDPGVATATPTTEGVIAAVASGHLTVSTSEPYINEDVYAHLLEAANDYYNEHKKGLILSSASRTLQKQSELFYSKCLKYGYCPRAVACDPTGSSLGSVVVRTGKNYTTSGSLASIDINNSSAVIAELVANGKVQYCPHTSNVAVDVWPDGHQSGYINNVADMDALASIMVKNGFCRLNSESWHFELNDVRTSKTKCSTANTTSKYQYGPQAGCNTWDYDDHCCVLPTNPTGDNSGLTMCKGK